MKQLVFVMSDFMPTNSANSILIKNIIGELKKHFNISVICLHTKENMPNYERIEQIDIYRVHNEDYDIRYSIGRYKNNSKIKRYIYKLKSIIIFFLSRTSVRKNLVKDYLHKLTELNINSSIIVPVCFPIESTLAVDEYSKIEKNNIVIPYFIDRFSSSSTLHRTVLNRFIKFKRNLKIEEKIIFNSYHTIMTTDWRIHLRKYLTSFQDKISILFLPSYSRNKNLDISSEIKEELNYLTYAGSFIKNTRSPKYLIKVMSKVLKNDTKNILNIYSKSQYDSYLKKHAKKNSQIHFNGYVDYVKMKSIISSSVILISIGNKNSTQTPSKIYEYVSTGKFIIHFYYSEEDPVLSILEKYNNHILIKMEKKNLNRAVNTIKEVLNKRIYKQLSQEELDILFHKETPQYFKHRFMNILRNDTNTTEEGF